MNIESVVNKKLCTGCGICFSLCPNNAISMKKKNDGYFPRVDSSKCLSSKGCMICFNICPGHAVNIEKLSKELFSANKADKNIGRYINCYTGYSSDYNIRYHSASGGMITQLLVFMLEKGLINGALITHMNNKNPLEPEVVIAKTTEEIISGKSSKYCPVSVCTGLKKIISSDGKYAVVGLPCHIHGFRKAEKLFPKIKDKIKIYLGIYCSSNKSFAATEYLFGKYNIPEDKIISFAYRDEGWLGNMVVKYENRIPVKYEYKEYYPKIRSFFIPYRCTLCIDHTAGLADISFGDIYIPEFWDDTIGTTSIITRSKRGKMLLQNAKKNGCIEIEEVNKKLLIKSQDEMLKMKKKHIKVKMVFVKALKWAFPKYDYIMPELTFLNQLKILISTCILYGEIAIGKRRKLWFLINYLNIFANIIKQKKIN